MADRVLLIGGDRGGRLYGRWLDPSDPWEAEELRQAHDPANWPPPDHDLAIHMPRPPQIPDFVDIDMSHPDVLLDYIVRVAAAEHEPEAVVWERLAQMQAAGHWPEQWRAGEWWLP